MGCCAEKRDPSKQPGNYASSSKHNGDFEMNSFYNALRNQNLK